MTTATATAASPVPVPPPAVSALPFGLFLGLRYLKPRRTFVSVITLICVAGVALGVMLPIVVISVMTGYDAELKSKVLGFDPHIQVTTATLIDGWRSLRAQIEGTPGVVAASPYVMGRVLAEAHNHRIAPMIRGVAPDLEARVIDIPGLMGKGSAGKFDLDGDNAVIGVDLAHLLDLTVGDTLTLYSPRNLENLNGELDKLKGRKADEAQVEHLRSLVTPVTLTVTGIFNSGRYQYDSDFVFVPLHIGQELYELGGRVHGIAVRTTEPYHADRVARALNEKFQRAAAAPPAPSAVPGSSEVPEEDLPGIPHAETWMELNAQFFDAVRTERSTMFVILSVVLVVAGFCVMNTLITVTVQKTREIGIMKAVGADVWQIVRVFASQGMVVGALGMVGGLGLGLGILKAINPFKQMMEKLFHVDVFARQVYGFGAIPYQTRPVDVAAICVSMFVICSLAALIPAYLAARLDPVKALRAE